jgi:hypothetical protein
LSASTRDFGTSNELVASSADIALSFVRALSLVATSRCKFALHLSPHLVQIAIGDTERFRESRVDRRQHRLLRRS